jgi:hypothetical protein
MDLDEIKRGLRAEIKKRENEQYATFQCNVRQMSKDVLAKLEEQEQELAEKDKELRRQKYERCLAMASYWVAVSYQCVDDKHRQSAERHHRKWLELAKKFKDKEAK